MTRPADAVVSAVAPALDALTVLRKARALIEKPGHWTQRANARDFAGVPVNMEDAAAVCFCAYGAIGRITGRFVHPAARVALHALQDAADESFFSIWNDSHTHAEVIAAFDKAIASLEAS